MVSPSCLAPYITPPGFITFYSLNKNHLRSSSLVIRWGVSGLCSRTVSPGTVVTAIGTCWGLPSRPWHKPCSRKLLFPLHSPRAAIHTSLTTGPWGVPVLLSRLHPSSLGGSWWAGMGALGPQHCPAGPGTTESREWVNGGLRQILPGTQPGVSGAQSSQPCQGELRGRGWDLRPPPRQALAANRGEQSGGASGTGHLASQTAPGERLPGSRALSPPLPSPPPGTAGPGLRTNSSWGGDSGSSSRSAEGGGGNQHGRSESLARCGLGRAARPTPRPQFTPPALSETQ